MPAPQPDADAAPSVALDATTCALTGTASSVVVEGDGGASFTEKDALSDGLALEVTLRETTVDGVHRSLVFRWPDGLAEIEPIKMQFDGSFAATYRVDKGDVQVFVRRGGEDGFAALRYPSNAGCPNMPEDGCALHWPGAQKTVLITPSAQGLVANKPLTGSFPTSLATGKLTKLQVALAGTDTWTCKFGPTPPPFEPGTYDLKGDVETLQVKRITLGEKGLVVEILGIRPGLSERLDKPPPPPPTSSVKPEPGVTQPSPPPPIDPLKVALIFSIVLVGSVALIRRRRARPSEPLPVPDEPRRELPITDSELFGRDNELRWLDACWNDRVFVASIIAWGGAGKTALVAKWLANMRDDTWCGAERHFIWSFYRQGTSTVGSSDTFFAEALKQFGDPDPTQGSPWEKGERLAKLVREKRTLLVLDGVEPMQWGPGEQEGEFKDPALKTFIAELAKDNTGLLLITSRFSLRELHGWLGKKVEEKKLDRLSPEAGARLLRMRGAKKGTDAELREAVEEYEGHALALAVLGSYLEDVAEGDIRRRKEIGPLIHDVRYGGHARRVMEAYEPWLGKVELSVLKLLGLFDRPATIAEIESLRARPVVFGLNDTLLRASARDWTQALGKLKRIGLVASGTGITIDAHPLVRQHYSEKFQKENSKAWREGHRRLYEFVRMKAPLFPATATEMEPLYVAVVHGCIAGKYHEALNDDYVARIQRGAKHFSLKLLGSFGSEVAMLSAFFDPPWERITPNLNEQARAFLLHQAGTALYATGRLHEGASLLGRALTHAVEHLDWKNASIAAVTLSELEKQRGELHQARNLTQKAIDFAGKSGDALTVSAHKTSLAAIQHFLGHLETAADLFKQAELAEQKRPPYHSQMYSYRGFWYCNLLLDQHCHLEVRERAEKSLSIAIRNEWLLDIALDHLLIGSAHLDGVERGRDGELADATSHIKQAVDGLRRAGQQDYIPLGLLARAELHIHIRAFADARRDIDEAMTIATRCGFRLHEADAHLGYARLAIAEGNAEVARKQLEQACQMVEEMGYHRRDRDLEQIAKGIEQLPPQAKPIAPSNEVIVAVSGPMTKKSEDRADLGIVVALQEEFRELLSMCGTYTQHKNEKLTAYRFNRGDYQVVAAFVGDMGRAQAGRVAERMIDQWHPKSIVVMGIAAGIHDDLRVGDVYVPSQANEYMQDAKVVPNPESPTQFVLVPGAPARRADFDLLDAVRNLEFGHANIYRDFVFACEKDLEQLLQDITTREQLVAQNLIRSKVAVLADGHVATGEVVGAAQAFTKWIRGHDRNVKALEMESAGVFMSAQEQRTVTRALAIRGISDYGDDRKKVLDEIGGGALRKYAMRNAVRLLLALLDANALPR